MLNRQARSACSGSRAYLSNILQRRQHHLWRSRFSDWDTKQDSSFLRYQRYRFLNTRAKALKRMRRSQQWDWGCATPFFTPRHVRLASHYNGKDRNYPRWQKDQKDEHESTRAEEYSESDGYELSAKEKSWKEQMDRMRKRTQTDPYEAVFGKRFEPFWGPLVPAWMRAEWNAELEPIKTEQKKSDSPEETRPGYAAYSSSTSWNSWTNKTKKSEWDSVSGQTRHYEYDPISNRMVQMVDNTALSKLPAAEPIGETKAEGGQRKAIPIPRFAEPEHPTGVSEQSANSEHLVEDLTAKDIRAAMGKSKTQDDAQVNILLSEDARHKRQPTASSHWDHAEQFVMLEQEVEALKAEKDRLLQRERRAFHFADLAKRVEAIQARISAAEARLEIMNAERAAESGHQSSHLRSAIDRMQSKPIQRAIDMDDSAAHESTEAASAVPKAWASQADLLQADRVTRTTSNVPFDNAGKYDASKLSKANEMLQAEVDRQKLVMKLHEEQNKDNARVLHGELLSAIKTASEKNPASVQALEARINELQQAETKYQSKIRALKQELDIAYTQSSRHADEFRDQIKQHEERNAKLIAVEEKYKRKITSLREDLDTAFKQSSEHADEFRHQISQGRAAASEQESSVGRQNKAVEKKYKAQITALKEELTLAYEQSSRHGDEFRRQIAALEKKLLHAAKNIESPISKPAAPTSSKTGVKESDRALIREIRGIYEDAYGVIGREDGKAATLEDCLDGYDSKKCYKFKPDSLESELSGKPSLTSAQIRAAYQSRPAKQVQKPAHHESKRAFNYVGNGSREHVSEESKAYQANEKRSAYAFKRDDLESELREPTETATPAPRTPSYNQICHAEDGLDAAQLKAYQANEKRSAYAFKGDDLEAELKEPQLDDLVKDARTGVYHFREDGLEKELQTPDSAKVKQNPAYRYRKDDLENELKGQIMPAVKDRLAYRFKHDNLESELTTPHAPATSEPAELDKKSYAFKKDNLEAELAAQAPDHSTTQENRASLRQSIAAGFKEVAAMLSEVRNGRPVSSRRNPIDGMTPAVNNYASPTGFVNHDPVLPFETPASKAAQGAQPHKVRREEAVFSGTRRVKHHHRHRHEQNARSRRGRKLLKLTAMAILLAGGAAYFAYWEGALMEKYTHETRTKLQREAWQKIAQEYERSGEKGVLKAMNEMQAADLKTSRNGGLFWK